MVFGQTGGTQCLAKATCSHFKRGLGLAERKLALFARSRAILMCDCTFQDRSPGPRANTSAEKTGHLKCDEC